MPAAPSTVVVRNPATGGELATVALATEEDVDDAVAAARAALPAWSAVSTQDRARMLRRYAEVVDAAGDELAATEAANVGKPIAGARWEADAVAEVLHYYAGAVDKHTGTTLPWADGLALTLHEPLGVVGLITPWNFPMLIASWKLGPALACGNTVVIKPSQLTPLTTARLGQLALDAGLPAGVVNVVVGTGATAGQRLLEHPDVAKIGFTGSTEVGKQIARGAVDRLKRVTLELGGKSANIVFADADLEAAAAGIPGAAFDNAGQDCCARSRILVERSVLDRFTDLAIEAARTVRVGPPDEPGATMGPLVSADHRETVASFVGVGGVEGDIAFQGDVPDGPGFWFPPTIVTGAAETSRIATEEVFGPVVTVLPFDGRPTPPASPTPPSTACPARSGRGTAPRRCGWRGPCRAAR